MKFLKFHCALTVQNHLYRAALKFCFVFTIAMAVVDTATATTIYSIMVTGPDAIPSTTDVFDVLPGTTNQFTVTINNESTDSEYLWLDNLSLIPMVQPGQGTWSVVSTLPNLEMITPPGGNPAIDPGLLIAPFNSKNYTVDYTIDINSFSSTFRQTRWEFGIGVKKIPLFFLGWSHEETVINTHTVPEPDSLLLITCGLACLGFFKMRARIDIEKAGGGLCCINFVNHN